MGQGLRQRELQESLAITAGKEDQRIINKKAHLKSHNNNDKNPLILIITNNINTRTTIIHTITIKVDSINSLKPTNDRL